MLVIDDDPDTCELLRVGLRDRRFDVEVASSYPEGLARLESSDFDAVVTDIRLADGSGFDVSREVAEHHEGIPVVIITGFADLDTAIQAIRAGGHDLLPKPVSIDALAISLHRAIQHSALEREVERLSAARDRIRLTHGLIGESPAMGRVYELIDRVAVGDATVLIEGESGTGKELVARALHDRSERSRGPFVAVNCAAVSATLLESELFGHTRGAFTDARTARAGLFVQAAGGTLFLDEIGDMPPEMQSKLLRALAERRVRPVGGDSEVELDTRIVAATNRDLKRDVDRRRFREDLYYRINVVGIEVPPLRARGRDVLLLAQHFLERAARDTGRPVRGLSATTAEKLVAYDWPGNVRELENAIERAVVLTRFEEITPEDLPEAIRGYANARMIVGGDDPGDLPSLEETERRYVRRVLEAVGGDKTRAARVLGVDRRALYRKLVRLRLH